MFHRNRKRSFPCESSFREFNFDQNTRAMRAAPIPKAPTRPALAIFPVAEEVVEVFGAVVVPVVEPVLPAVVTELDVALACEIYVAKRALT
jgi:hypothetical protein